MNDLQFDGDQLVSNARDLVHLQINKGIRLLEQDPEPRRWPAEAAELLVVHPEKYLQVVQLLCDGDSIEKVRKATGLGRPALRAIMDRHPVIQQEQQIAIKRLSAEGLHTTLEAIVEKHDEISPNKLGFLMDLQVKANQLMSGGPTSRHETVHVASPADLEKMFEQLPSVKEI